MGMFTYECMYCGGGESRCGQKHQECGCDNCDEIQKNVTLPSLVLEVNSVGKTSVSFFLMKTTKMKYQKKIGKSTLALVLLERTMAMVA